jgi:hypothetical protein
VNQANKVLMAKIKREDHVKFASFDLNFQQFMVPTSDTDIGSLRKNEEMKVYNTVRDQQSEDYSNIQSNCYNS